MDNFLLRTLSGVPRSRVYRLLRKGEVRVNGKRIRPNYRLQAGDQVRLPPVRLAPPSFEQSPSPRLLESLKSAILYLDAEIIVLNKPAGLAVHGGSGIDFGVIECLRPLYGQRLELAHRIDRDTSGCLVLARTRPALLALHDAFRNNQVGKRYDFLTYGRWPASIRTARQKLRRYVTKSGERRVKVDLAGKSCRTDFTVHRCNGAKSWIIARPHTGRTHQIRVHAQACYQAIIGDQKYASEALLLRAHAAGIKRLCLHASTLTMTLHGNRRKFSAPLPEDFQCAWDSLGKT